MAPSFDKDHASQLYRYFNVTQARFGVLTDGIIYQFFSDLEAPNKMDDRPFFELNLLDFSDAEIEELRRFTKASFDLDQILSNAKDLKYTREIKRLLASEWTKPFRGLCSIFRWADIRWTQDKSRNRPISPCH